MLRAMLMACSSLSARWSVTPEVLQCSCAPPRSSALTSSPVAACRHLQFPLQCYVCNSEQIAIPLWIRLCMTADAHACVFWQYLMPRMSLN